jgi:hypothetical protein
MTLLSDIFYAFLALVGFDLVLILVLYLAQWRIERRRDRAEMRRACSNFTQRQRERF